MNLLLLLSLAAGAYLLLEAGYVFFALIMGVALLLAAVSSWFSSRGEKAGQEARPPPTPVQPPEFKKQEHGELQKVWLSVGMVFNFFGKGIYRFLRYGFNPPEKR